MDSFWSKLLILGIVAAIGMFFIINVYAPQKAAQQAMAESTQQTVNAVKAGVDGSTGTISSSQDVINTVTALCKIGNTTQVIVDKATGISYTFKTELTSGGLNISTIAETGKNYTRIDSLGLIRFRELP